MALKLKLKPEETVVIGGAVIKNGGKSCELFIENSVPILRQKDILSERDTNSPCKRVYFAVQLMYIDGANMAKYHQSYWELVNEICKAAPSTTSIIQQISDNILTENYYQALKCARKLIDYEEELLQHAKCL